MTVNEYGYGIGDASYKAAGEKKGIEKLVTAFYGYMDSVPKAENIRGMHAPDLQLSNEKLTLFLCGWLGGPRLYKEKYGGISIPGSHAHLKINEAERDAWMLCMSKALDDQVYPDSFKQYLLEQLFVPADRVRIASQTRHGTQC